MTKMSNWNDDEALIQELRAAVAPSEAVSERSRDAARSAFTWRNVDKELEELLSLSHYSSLVEDVLVRGAAVSESRALAFEGAGFGLEVELTGDALVGQVVPGRTCRVVVRSAAGATAAVEVEEDGFFTMTDVPQGTVRFEVALGDAGYATEWVLL
jgi:hypothetical protein